MFLAHLCSSLGFAILLAFDVPISALGSASVKTRLACDVGAIWVV